MSKIYLCTGSCHGQSKQPGTCQANVCERKGMPLEEMEQCEHCGQTYQLGEVHSCRTH